MKIGKSQLRQILIEELGDIISEQVTIEVNRQLRKKTTNLLFPENGLATFGWVNFAKKSVN